MNTNQSFIGAYARNRRGAAPNQTAAELQPTIPPAPAEHVPAEHPPIDDTGHVEELVKELLGQSMTVSDTFIETSEVWIDQPEGQVFRVDRPASPLPVSHPVEPLMPVTTNESVDVEEIPPAERWAGATWEVDAFDIPQSVAELFFDEEFFRSIAEHLGQSVRDGLRSVLVTSIAAGEGRSTVAIGTAIAAAATGIRVALVDIDLQTPSQAEVLRLEVETDWVTAIRHGQPLEDAAVASLEDGVTLLPLILSGDRSLPVTPAEIDRLIEQLSGCFDLIMFDGPVIDSWATTRIASSVDSSLIVRDARSTSKSDVALAAERLRSQGIKGIGVIDNFCG